jgi:hypothetical protein
MRILFVAPLNKTDKPWILTVEQEEQLSNYRNGSLSYVNCYYKYSIEIIFIYGYLKVTNIPS